MSRNDSPERGSALAGRRALVTGGGRGIGRAIAARLASAGAEVIVSGRRADALRAAADELGAEPIAADLGSPDGPAELAEACAARGAIDILVNNAGIAGGAALSRTDDATWERTLAVNATAPFRLCRSFVPGMIEAGWGRVINIASTAGVAGAAYTSAYCASKHALVGLTRALAAELGDRGVTVNAICPGWVETDMAEQAVERIAGATGRDPGGARRVLENMSAQRRLMSPGEVAHLALSLCADDARGIHGQAIVVDGGGVQR